MEEYEFAQMGIKTMWESIDQESQKKGDSNMHGQKHQLNQLIDLYRAKQRLKLFICQINDLAHTPIRQDILIYCGGQKKSMKNLETCFRPESILKKIDIRIEKMLKTKKLKRNWGEEDLNILIWIASKYCDFKHIQDLEKDIDDQDWKFIASVIPGVTAEGCMFKWLSIKKITLATYNWTNQQSQFLAKIVSERLRNSQGAQVKDWKEISHELYRLNTDQDKVYRNAKQCRQHWTCYLSPQLKKGPWQLYEDVKLLKFIRDNKGLKKWSEIARHFEGRTENALKNRYTLIIQKQKRTPRNRNKNELDLIKQYLEKCYVDQFTANVKMQENIYQEQSSMKQYHEQIDKNLAKKQQNNYDTYQSVITPLKVQKFSICDFQMMNSQFLKSIQPGVIQSDGTFKKISNNLSEISNKNGVRLILSHFVTKVSTSE